MKEKIISYIEALEEKSLQVDDYFKQRNELYISNQEKDREIERLNNKLELINKIVEREFPPNEFITYKIKKILKGVEKE